MPRKNQLDLALFGVVPFYEPTAGFIGRNRELRIISSQFESGARLGCIVGRVGVGKTSLAWVFCATRKKLFPGVT